MSEDLTGKLVIDLIINGKFVALVMDDGEASYLSQDEAEVDEDDIMTAAKMAEDALLERAASIREWCLAARCGSDTELPVAPTPPECKRAEWVWCVPLVCGAFVLGFLVGMTR